jgi:hypothetical protein
MKKHTKMRKKEDSMQTVIDSLTAEKGRLEVELRGITQKFSRITEALRVLQEGAHAVTPPDKTVYTTRTPKRSSMPPATRIIKVSSRRLKWCEKRKGAFSHQQMAKSLNVNGMACQSWCSRYKLMGYLEGLGQGLYRWKGRVVPSDTVQTPDPPTRKKRGTRRNNRAAVVARLSGIKEMNAARLAYVQEQGVVSAKNVAARFNLSKHTAYMWLRSQTQRGALIVPSRDRWSIAGTKPVDPAPIRNASLNALNARKLKLERLHQARLEFVQKKTACSINDMAKQFAIDVKAAGQWAKTQMERGNLERIIPGVYRRKQVL